MRIAFICTEKLTVPPIRGGAIQILINGVAPYISEKHALTIYCITDPELPDREYWSNHLQTLSICQDEGNTLDVRIRGRTEL